jgi:hypothetical protein
MKLDLSLTRLTSRLAVAFVSLSLIEASDPIANGSHTGSVLLWASSLLSERQRQRFGRTKAQAKV